MKHMSVLRVGAVVGATLVALVGWSPAATAQPGGGSVTVTVASSANPSAYGEGVTYTATVVTSDGLDVSLIASVEFQDNGGDIIGCNAQPLSPSPTLPAGSFIATCDEPGNQMSVGTHPIEAYFNNDPNYAPNSGSLTQVVAQGPTSTTISYPLAGASLPYGNEGQNPFVVTVAAAPGVTDQSPSGNVSIYTGVPGPNTYLCSTGIGGPGNGQSTGNCYLNSNTLDAGTYQLTAVYTGDGNFLGSTSTPQALTVDQVDTQMNVFAVPGYAFYGAENGNFLIVGASGGNGGNPTGSFTITSAGTNLVAPGACPAGNGGGNPCYLDSATALPASTTPYTVDVSYPGDVNFTPASTSVSLLVFPATTTTSLTVTPSTVTFGREDHVGVSVTVRSGTSGSPTGTVLVQHDGSTVCTVGDLQPSGPDTATGSCPALGSTQLPTGNYGLTAVYRGDGNYQSSVSATQALTVADQGYWLVGANGAVFPFGPAPSLASAAGLPLGAPIVGIASTADGGGYWEVARDGGVFAFGDATFYGSMGGVPLNRPVVGITADPATGGYWLVAADGGIFSFDAPFLGSTGSGPLNAPIVGMTPKPDGQGYWEVASDGGVFAFGDAPFLGSLGGQRLDKPIVAVSSTADGDGYRMAASDGGIFTFGDAQFSGSKGGQPLAAPIVGLAG